MTDDCERSKVDELFAKLGSDSQRLVKLIVGESKHAIHIQQSVLESASDYFTKAFCDDRFSESKSGILKLPEDSVDVWKILINWIIYREVPEESLRSDLLLSIQCWTTGDKYDIKEFQDAVMLCMLTELVSDHPEAGFKLSTVMIQTALESTVFGSPLRDLIVDRKVSEYGEGDDEEENEDKDERTWRQLGALDGTGFLPHLAKARKSILDYGNESFFTCDSRQREVHWLDYMVSTTKKKGIQLPESLIGKVVKRARIKY